MLSLEEQVKKHNGVLKRLENCAISLQLPITVTQEAIKEVILAVDSEYGQENLRKHIDIKRTKVQIIFYYKG